MFNLYLAIYRFGVLAYHFFTEAYNGDFYFNFLLPKLGDALKKVEEETDFEATVVHHDNCLNGKKDSHALDKYLGAGRWTTYMGAPCKVAVSYCH